MEEMDVVIEEVNQGRSIVVRNSYEISKLMKMMFIVSLVNIGLNLLNQLLGEFFSLISLVGSLILGFIQFYYLYAMSKYYIGFKKVFYLIVCSFLLSNFTGFFDANDPFVALLTLAVAIVGIYAEVSLLKTTAAMCNEVSEELGNEWTQIVRLMVYGLASEAILAFLSITFQSPLFIALMLISIIIILVASIKEIIAYKDSYQFFETLE